MKNIFVIASDHRERSNLLYILRLLRRFVPRNDTFITFSILFLTIFTFFLTGCAEKKPQFLSPSEAEKKLIQICQEEYGINVIVRRLGNTLWIYLPFEHHIVDYKASNNPLTKMNLSSKKPVLEYIDGKFSENNFDFEYSVNNYKNYPDKDRGYTSHYTEEFQTAQRAVYTALVRAYGDAESNDTDDMPEFIVSIITDLEKGLELESILYYDDLKRASSNPPDLTQEEFLKRYVNELRGDETGINDKTGDHIKYREIELPDFLTKQIINRITFKFQSSDFPPSENTKDEIIQIIQETLNAYQFKDYQSIQLKDLKDDSNVVIEKDKL